MDFDVNDYLSFSWLMTGRYDFRSNNVVKDDNKKFKNQLCAFINILVGLKSLLIVFYPNEKGYFLLIDLYIIDSFSLRLFTFGACLLRIGIGFHYIYWSYLCSNPKRLKCLNHLFMTNSNELCKTYDLDLMLTKKFLKKAFLIRILLEITAFGFDLFFALFSIRCLVLSYLTFEFNYFLYISVPMTIITMFSYHCLGYVALRFYTVFFITIDFLILRSRCVAKQILNFSENQRSYSPNYKRIILRKTKSQTFQLLKRIKEIVIQFEDVNRIFDYIVTPIYVNVLIAGLAYPGFVFTPMPTFFLILVFALYLGGESVGLIVSVMNDNFVDKMRNLAYAIHRSVTNFEGVDFKLNLENYLILNNEHKVISFTYLRRFDYSTMYLVEYLIHSLSLVFMMYSAIRMQ